MTSTALSDAKAENRLGSFLNGFTLFIRSSVLDTIFIHRDTARVPHYNNCVLRLLSSPYHVNDEDAPDVLETHSETNSNQSA